jgi:hypothetical protein
MSFLFGVKTNFSVPASATEALVIPVLIKPSMA